MSTANNLILYNRHTPGVSFLESYYFDKPPQGANLKSDFDVKCMSVNNGFANIHISMCAHIISRVK